MNHLTLILIATTSALLPAQPQPNRIVSGLQPGKLVRPFHVLDTRTGRKIDFVGENYARRPVALIFARDFGDPLKRLVKNLDDKLARNNRTRHALVVWLTEEENATNKLSHLVRTQKIRHVDLGIVDSRGPKGYNLAKGAEVTAIVYRNRRVIVTHAFRTRHAMAMALSQIEADLR